MTIDEALKELKEKDVIPSLHDLDTLLREVEKSPETNALLDGLMVAMMLKATTDPQNFRLIIRTGLETALCKGIWIGRKQGG